MTELQRGVFGIADARRLTLLLYLHHLGARGASWWHAALTASESHPSILHGLLATLAGH